MKKVPGSLTNTSGVPNTRIVCLFCVLILMTSSQLTIVSKCNWSRICGEPVPACFGSKIKQVPNTWAFQISLFPSIFLFFGSLDFPIAVSVFPPGLVVLVSRFPSQISFPWF